MSRRAVVALVAVVAVVVAGLVVWRLRAPGSPLEQALALAPAGTSRASWTDWEGVRRELDADLDAGSSPEAVGAFMGEAFAADLSAMSALGSSAAVMQHRARLLPRHDHLGAPRPVARRRGRGDGGGRRGRLRRPRRAASPRWAGPSRRGADGVWVGGPDVLSGVGPGLTPELQHFVLLEDRGVVLASDQAGYLEQVIEVVDGGAEGADDLDDLAAGLAAPLAAAVYDGAYACERLAMSQADDDAQAEADQLVEAAGGVHPLTGFAMGLLAGGDLRAVMEVEDADDAPGDAEARAQLAAGPAPGQGGDFSDRFTVEAGRLGGPRDHARPATRRRAVRRSRT